jgi:predicted small metal-binding protein
MGADCDFLVRAETAAEVIGAASEHGCRVHKICEITSEAKERMNSLMRSVWCGEDFGGIGEKGTIAPQKEWMEN